MLNVLWVVIAIIQVIDILIHAATNQLEAIRVASNIVIFSWLAVVAFGKNGAKIQSIAASAIGAYVVLNGIFLTLNGLTNNGEVRGTLFLLITLTVTLSVLLVTQSRRLPQ